MADQEKIPAKNAIDAHAQNFRGDWHISITHSASISSKITQCAHFIRSLLEKSDIFGVCSRIPCRLYQLQSSSPLTARAALAKAEFNKTLFTSKLYLNLR
jgi:hypothetical protein